MPERPSSDARFMEVLTAAIAEMVEFGFDSAERVTYWAERLRVAMEREHLAPRISEAMLTAALRKVYKRLITDRGVIRMQPEMARFTLERVAPQLRAELDRRIMAAANLIKLNREEMIGKTLRRFSGWATSIPAGGSDLVERRAVKADIKRGIAGLKFQERRVLIDQGHKLTSALSDIAATEGGAIAAIWHSHWRQPNYNYRPEHKEHDVLKGGIFVVRGNWALERGLMKLAGRQYTDEIERPGELVYCRCFYEYLFNLRDLPEEMITAKGRAELARARAQLEAMA
jgi:hypothetical protein